MLVTSLLSMGLGSLLFVSSVITWMLDTADSSPSDEYPNGFDSTLYALLRVFGTLTSDILDSEYFYNVAFSILLYIAIIHSAL